MISGYSIDEKEPPKASTLAREAFFLEFAEAIRQKFDDVPLMVTGGFRTRQGMEKAVASGACDLVGLGRPAVLYPDLPKKIIFNKEVPDEEAVLKTETVSHDWLARVLGVRVLARGTETVRESLPQCNIISARRMLTYARTDVVHAAAAEDPVVVQGLTHNPHTRMNGSLSVIFLFPVLEYQFANRIPRAFHDPIFGPSPASWSLVACVLACLSVRRATPQAAHLRLIIDFLAAGTALVSPIAHILVYPPAAF